MAAPEDPQPWVGTEADLPADRTLETFEWELALVDRIRGLEAQLAQVASTSKLSPDQQLRAEQELALLRGSLTWRAGRAATAPLRVLQKVVRRRQR